ncbi:SDR family NAD(P)-dependent oxidoreductase [Arthrobacter cupressi]|uniref:NAD(P)-dependent dehydrogenase, short-chain alcohol dehydrogenase family n=1 Tax=Arthrobacter cupressi TaxID=1045773 RepID=A0A1G8QCE8_9MICC|nr:SDR family NAD(P)-dependent oxidoreductase [Arthrobacter cupressi]NYD78094.1 NAD(P)-dependent dehydrogenase (short-subunit alcohol dehydrogenase family) [Arthrobacter cupressi]SDJ02288.1 NAD(P)-dependent dehydrogenase, short-chain alcohol dehydrogenase family [Arthrobacter cupressi]
MSRILVTGSADGLGRAAAAALLDDGHSVVVHVRAPERLAAVRDLLDGGAQAVVGDLAKLDEVRALADQANALGRFDAVIHNAGVLGGRALLPVNVVAPFVLTAEIERPERLIYLSSGWHRSGQPDLDGVDWSGARESRSYPDSKLFVTALAAAVARLWPEVRSHAVDPGWVPTRMGGPGAPGDLRLGHVTQAWLAVSDSPEALTSGGYWYHQATREPHPAVHDEDFQAALLRSLADYTGSTLPGGGL